MRRTQLGKGSVYSYQPYSKGIYGLDDPTLCAEQNRLYRARNQAVEELKAHLDCCEAEEYLWKAIRIFENYPFKTCRGIPMRYTVCGNELHFDWKQKVLTKECVMTGFHRAREIVTAEGFVNGPKKLGTTGASYLYPVFLSWDAKSEKALSR